MRSNCIDETGKSYGFLTVLYPEKTKTGRAGWKCKCVCGKEIIVRGSDLRANRYTSCGCQKGKKKAYDIANNKYGYLTAIKYEYSKNTKQFWSFSCECGKQIIRQKQLVVSGKIKSCGCKSLSLNSFNNRSFATIGETFGLQKVIKNISNENSFGKTKVLCKCIKCGLEKEWFLAELRHNPERSCICCLSYKEYQINCYLKEKNIHFKTQYVFNDLVSKNNRCLRFDFGILNDNNELKGLIEYNGEQHYKQLFYDTKKENFLSRQERDLQKINYCKKNSIPLLILNKNSSLFEEIDNFIKIIK